MIICPFIRTHHILTNNIIHTYIYIYHIITIINSYAAKRLNDLDAAERALTHALALDPASEVALYHLAALLHRKLRYNWCITVVYVFNHVLAFTYPYVYLMHLYVLCVCIILT